VCEPDRLFDGREVRIVPAGQWRLPHPALGSKGGGTIETDPQDKTGLATKTPQFMVYAKADGLGSPGERVSLRFTLPGRPLGAQWLDRLRRLIQGRINI
jgi:hypothetical protein